MVSVDGKSGFINTDGKMVIKLTDKLEYSSFSENYAEVYKNNKWGFIDENGKIVVKPTFYGIRDFGSICGSKELWRS